MKLKQDVKVYVLKPKISNEEIALKEGYYFEEHDFDLIIKDDADVYRLDNKGNKHLLLKIRKNVIPRTVCKKAFNALVNEAKKPHTNRGAAGGILTKRKLPPYVKSIIKKGKFRAKYYGHNERIRKDDISNLSRSSIIGYYDQIDRNYYRNKNKNHTTRTTRTTRTPRTTKKTINKIPCRETKFTKEKTKLWQDTFDLFKEIDKQFNKLVPEAHKKQLERASKTPNFQILNTAFSTATINYNWQTALHKDAGDFEEGFGNLIILEDKEKHRKEWTGGYLGFPQYGVAVDIREGDFLAMDVHQWHCNTSINIIENNIEKDNNLEKGDNIEKEDYARLSVVSYLRKNMIKCS